MKAVVNITEKDIVSIDKGYMMVVCTRQDAFPCDIKFIHVNELVRRFFLSLINGVK